MWFDTTDEVLYLEFIRDYLESDVPWIKQNMIDMLEGKPFRQLVIIMSKTHKVENRKTREKSNAIFVEADIKEVAFVGGSAANRMIAKVLLKTGALKTQGNFFGKTEDAVKWLKSKR